ncbi:MAG: OmpP1/FadL family transporter [Pseudomonas sp.]
MWFCPLLGSGLAQAGGLTLYELGTDDVGLANAGTAARAQGPSTIAYNPAGLSFLEGTQITAGAQLLHSNLAFDRDSSPQTAGDDSGDILPWVPGGSFFASQRLDNQWSVGFGAYGDFGMSIDYDNDWSGRYFSQYSALLGLSLVPSAAYRFNDEWSVGLGLRAMNSLLQVESAIDRSPLGLTDRSDGQVKYEDSAWGYGAVLGVIYQPQAGTRIGLNYTSKIDLNFEDRLNVKGGVVDRLNGLKIELDVQVPQSVTLSLYQQLDERWALLASTNWQDWSEFGEIDVTVATDGGITRATTVDANFRDTWHLSLGTQYQATEKWLWNAGIAYDSSAVSDDDRTFASPMGESYHLATGVSYAMDRDTVLNFSWSLIWLGDQPVEQTQSLSNNRTSGQFSDVWIQAYSANMTWHF